MKKDTIVLGLGNPLMSDEGIGVFLVNRFIRQQDKYPHLDFIDAGTGGMNILHLIANYSKAVFIDCALMGTTPGTIKKFSPAEVQSIKKLRHYSLHEVDILRIIDLAKALDLCPEKIVFFGIEPAAIQPGETLSKILTANIDFYLTLIAGDF